MVTTKSVFHPFRKIIRTKKYFLSFGRRVFLQGGALIILAGIPALFAWTKLSTASETLLPDELTAQDARLSSGGVVWVDARNEQDFAAGHAPNAILLNDEKWDSMVENLFATWEPGKTIIVYCNAGCQASHRVAERIRDLGMEPVFVLKGGYDAWQRASVSHRLR